MIMQRQPDGSYKQIGFIKSKDGENIDTIVDAKGDVYFTQGFTREISGIPPLTLDAIGKNTLDYKIYGNSIQDGTPTPENPVEIQSVGELVTEGEFSGKYVIPVVVSGKNLINPQTTINGYRLGSDGNLFRENSYTTTDFIKVIPSKFYTRNIGFTVTNPICEYDANKTFIRRVTNGTDIMLSPDAHYVRTAFNSDYLSNIQLELGSEATAYEPYHEPITTNIYLDEPLRKIGDYADVIDFNRGVVERKIGYVAFDGSERWFKDNELSDTIRYYSVNNFPQRIETASDKCSHFEHRDYPAINTLDVISFSVANRTQAVFRVSKVDFPTINSFKAWLGEQYTNGTPVTVYYALAEPTTEPISLPSIPTFDGTTVISTDTEIQPSNIEIKYKARK